MKLLEDVNINARGFIMDDPIRYNVDDVLERGGYHHVAKIYGELFPTGLTLDEIHNLNGLFGDYLGIISQLKSLFPKKVNTVSVEDRHPYIFTDLIDGEPVPLTTINEVIYQPYCNEDEMLGNYIRTVFKYEEQVQVTESFIVARQKETVRVKNGDGNPITEPLEDKVRVTKLTGNKLNEVTIDGETKLSIAYDEEGRLTKYVEPEKTLTFLYGNGTMLSGSVTEVTPLTYGKEVFRYLWHVGVSDTGLNRLYAKGMVSGEDTYTVILRVDKPESLTIV